MNATPQAYLLEHTVSEFPQAERTCNIVTFYEDFAGATRAHHAFDCIARRFAGGRPVHATSWSFGMLANPEFNVAVVLDAAAADVMVIAAKGDRELPARIATWVEMCVRTGENPEPVVVALHDDGLESDGGAAPLCSVLEKIASRQGATFICNHNLKDEMDCELPIEPNFDESRSPVRIAGRVPEPTPEIHRWWGIND